MNLFEDPFDPKLVNQFAKQIEDNKLTYHSRELFYQLNQPGKQHDIIPWAFRFISESLNQINPLYSATIIQQANQPFTAIEIPPLPALPNHFQSRKYFNNCVNQCSPFMLTQLSWLHNVFQIANGQTDLALRLLSFYLKLAGAGNMLSSYQALLLTTRNKNPVLFSRVYSQQSTIISSMFDFATTQLALSRLPRIYFPEILGFTLAYCKLPTIIETCFTHYQFPDEYFKQRQKKIALHTPLLINCINHYLDCYPQKKSAIQLRITQGFWLYYDKTRQCRDSFLHHQESQVTPEQKIATILQQKIVAAKGHHHNIQLDGIALEQWFSGMPDNFPQFLTALKNSRYIDSDKPSESLLLKLFDFKGPMFGVLNQEEIAQLKQWLQTSEIEINNSLGEINSIKKADLQSLNFHSSIAYKKLNNRELYYYLINADIFPDVLPITKTELTRLLQCCSIFNPRPFKHYTHSQFDAFIEHIYQQEIAAYQPLTGKPKFTKAAYIWGMEQIAPLILIDGCWLQNSLALQTIKPEISDLLFRIYCDELGNGKREQNHPYIFQQLLESLSITTPPVYSKAFTEHPGFIKPAFDLPVYMLALSHFPVEHLPELLGLNMAIELSGLGKDYMTLVDELNYWKIDPTIATLHISIDNYISGHTLLAKQAIQIYMDDVIQNAKDQTTIDKHWQRIYTGYSSLRFVGKRFKFCLPFAFIINRFKQKNKYRLGQYKTE